MADDPNTPVVSSIYVGESALLSGNPALNASFIQPLRNLEKEFNATTPAALKMQSVRSTLTDSPAPSPRRVAPDESPPPRRVNAEDSPAPKPGYLRTTMSRSLSNNESISKRLSLEKENAVQLPVWHFSVSPKRKLPTPQKGKQTTPQKRTPQKRGESDSPSRFGKTPYVAFTPAPGRTPAPGHSRSAIRRVRSQTADGEETDLEPSASVFRNIALDSPIPVYPGHMTPTKTVSFLGATDEDCVSCVKEVPRKTSGELRDVPRGEGRSPEESTPEEEEYTSSEAVHSYRMSEDVGGAPSFDMGVSMIESERYQVPDMHESGETPAVEGRRSQKLPTPALGRPSLRLDDFPEDEAEAEAEVEEQVHVKRGKGKKKASMKKTAPAVDPPSIDELEWVEPEIDPAYLPPRADAPSKGNAKGARQPVEPVDDPKPAKGVKKGKRGKRHAVEEEPLEEEAAEPTYDHAPAPVADDVGGVYTDAYGDMGAASASPEAPPSKKKSKRGKQQSVASGASVASVGDGDTKQLRRGFDGGEGAKRRKREPVVEINAYDPRDDSPGGMDGYTHEDQMLSEAESVPREPSHKRRGKKASRRDRTPERSVASSAAGNTSVLNSPVVVRGRARRHNKVSSPSHEYTTSVLAAASASQQPRYDPFGDSSAHGAAAHATLFGRAASTRARTAPRARGGDFKPLQPKPRNRGPVGGGKHALMLPTYIVAP